MGPHINLSLLGDQFYGAMWRMAWEQTSQEVRLLLGGVFLTGLTTEFLINDQLSEDRP